jgi:predicted nuclease of predicted toxin-antitoxin system
VRFLLDEMFPAGAAQQLRDEFGHDAVHVSEVGLAGVADAEVGNTARAEKRVVVTENVADFAPEPDLMLVCILKRNLPSGGAQAHALATMLDRWANDNPRPYVGQHWPT